MDPEARMRTDGEAAHADAALRGRAG